MQWLEQVSARESEVLAAIRGHQSNAQIATNLHLSVRTVESHVSSLLRKAGVTDRRSLATLADTSVDSGLPVFPTSFVGREQERAAVVSALRGPRLVSLVGTGGMGKTRLAVEVARELAGDTVFVDLVPVRAGVARAVAQVLGATERPPGTPTDAVVDRLRSAHTLLVLDNCEHVIAEAGELIARILRSCPQVRVLATSRERLAVTGEALVRVPPLGPDAPELFVARVRAVDPDLDVPTEVVERWCAALDGMPLAIELVAARTGSLGVDGVQAALADRLRLVSGGRDVDARHRSLGAVLGWSLDLLDDDERRLFRRLGVFVGGFDLAAVAALNPEHEVGAIADLLGRLVDRSLVVRRSERWSLLATVRAVAAHELAASGEDVLPRYVRWAADTATAMDSRIGTAAEFDAVADDLRHALSQAEPDETAHRLARSLARLSFGRGLVVEARELYRTAADLAPDPAADLVDAGWAALTASDGETAFSLFLEAGAFATAAIAATRFSMSFTEPVSRDRVAALLAKADERGVAELAIARAWIAGQWPLEPDLDAAREAVSAARRTGDVALVLSALDALGTALANAGRLREAHRLCDERLRLAASAPRHEPRVAAELVDLFHAASTSAIATGDLHAAAAIAGLDSPIGSHPAILAPRMVRLYGLSGRFDEAIAQADVLWQGWLVADTAGPGSELSALRGEWPSSAASVAALVHGLRGDLPLFEEWRSRALRIARVDEAADSPGLAASAAFVDARIAVHTGRFGEAARLVDAAFAPFAEKWWQAYAHAAGAELAVVAGLPDAVERLAAAEPAAENNDWAAACLTRATARHTGDPRLMAEAVTRWTRVGARFELAATQRLVQ